MGKFRMMKVFDCQDMPDDVSNAFFADSDEGNDVCVEWSVGPVDEPIDEDDEYESRHHTVDAWLLANGAEPLEAVMVRHWW